MEKPLSQPFCSSTTVDIVAEWGPSVCVLSIFSARIPFSQQFFKTLRHYSAGTQSVIIMSINYVSSKEVEIATDDGDRTAFRMSWKSKLLFFSSPAQSGNFSSVERP